jgi:hypothetical protein
MTIADWQEWSGIRFSSLVFGLELVFALVGATAARHRMRYPLDDGLGSSPLDPTRHQNSLGFDRSTMAQAALIGFLLSGATIPTWGLLLHCPPFDWLRAGQHSAVVFLAWSLLWLLLWLRLLVIACDRLGRRPPSRA